MTAVLLGSFKVESPEWHAARAAGLGGSEIAAVLGLSKWESRFSLWHRKAGLIPPQDVNNIMSWGTRLEPAILAKWQEDHPHYVSHAAGTYCHPGRPWQIANPDLLASAPGLGMTLVEAKTALNAWEWGEPGTDDVPPYYLCQVRWYMDVFGLDLAWLVVLISGHDYREYVIRQDAADVELMRREAKAFLDSLPGGPNEQRPDLDAHDATYEAVKSLHPEIEDEDVELTADVAREFCDAKRAFDAAEARKQQATTYVADLLGDARRARFLGKTIAYRQAKGAGTPYLVSGRGLPTFDDLEQTA